MDCEESNHYSVSQEKRETHSVPIQTPATLSALSKNDLSLYFSFIQNENVEIIDLKHG